MTVPESVDPELDCSQCEGKYHDIKDGKLNNHKDHQGLYKNDWAYTYLNHHLVSSVKDSGRYLACSTRIFVDEAQCTLNFGIKSNRGLYENMVEKALINIIFEPHSCPKESLRFRPYSNNIILLVIKEGHYTGPFGIGSPHIRLEHFDVILHVKCCTLTCANPRSNDTVECVTSFAKMKYQTKSGCKLIRCFWNNFWNFVPYWITDSIVHYNIHPVL